MKYNTIIFRAAAAVLLGVLIFAVSRVVSIVREQRKNEQTAAHMAQMAVVQTPSAPEEQPTTCTPAQEEAPKQETVPMPISVDFALLQQENEDIVAWIYCPDTPINYPVVQGEDNEYYLEHMANGQWNEGGSIFLDYRSTPELTDAYSLIHGHNQHTQAMFGSLPSYADQTYYEQHRLLYILTPSQNYILELFAGYDTQSDDGLYSIPETQQRRDIMVENAIARSDFSSDVRPQADDRLLALSTCSYAYSDARYVVIGILRENGTGE